jgi:hypothetical protein
MSKIDGAGAGNHSVPRIRRLAPVEMSGHNETIRLISTWRHSIVDV